MAHALAMEGVRLVINSRSADKLSDVRAEIVEATGANVVSIAADLTDPEGVNSLVAQTEEAFGSLFARSRGSRGNGQELRLNALQLGRLASTGRNLRV